MYFINIYACFWFHIRLQWQGVSAKARVCVGPDSSIIFIVFLSPKAFGISPHCNPDFSHFPLCWTTEGKILCSKIIAYSRNMIKSQKSIWKVKECMWQQGKSPDEATATQYMSGLNFCIEQRLWSQPFSTFAAAPVLSVFLLVFFELIYVSACTQ